MIARVCMALLAGAALAPDVVAQQRPRCAHCAPAVIVEANHGARQSPTANGFTAARQIYVYAPGAIYRLYANPNFVSAILLEPGETINAVAAGDTSRWQVSETDGEGRSIVLVKPHDAGLSTNIVLITDRHTYTVEAQAIAGNEYSAQIAWTYPEMAQTPEPPRALHFDYRIATIRGPRPPWVPSRVFDDGAKTFIEFPEAAASSDLPPLFVVGIDGIELANYRVEPHRYVVDRVFDRAELRFGRGAPVVVRIDRGAPPPPPPRRHRGPRS